MIEKVVKRLQNLSKDDERFTNIKSGVTNVLRMLGNMNSGSSTKDPVSLPENNTAVRALIYLYSSTSP